MTFDLRVTFTGICAFVPDDAFDKGPKKICVILPFGEKKKKAKDGTKLCRHRTMVLFDLRNLTGRSRLLGGHENTGVWYLKKQRLTFDVTGGGDRLNIGDLRNLCSMASVAPDFSRVDPSHFKWSRDPQVSQVMFDKGELSVEKENIPWSVQNTLSGDYIYQRPLTYEAVLKIEDVASLELRARPLDGKGKEVRLPLRARTGREVKITIANLCDKNPLRWKAVDKERLPDEDFKWYFEILDAGDLGNLNNALGGLNLPIPYPSGSSNGRGLNCVPVHMQPYNFTMD